MSLTKPEVTITSKAYAAPRMVPITAIRRASMLNSPSCDPPAASVYQQPNELMHRMAGTLHGDPVTDSVFIIDIDCPLTVWEDRLRGEQLATGFIERWIDRPSLH